LAFDSAFLPICLALGGGEAEGKPFVTTSHLLPVEAVIPYSHSPEHSYMVDLCYAALSAGFVHASLIAKLHNDSTFFSTYRM